MNGAWDDDERLAADLAEAMRTERAVPPRFVAAAKAAFAWRTIDAELAAVTFDSARGSADALAGTRAERASVRTLTFASSGLTIDVELTADALLGQVVPARPGEVLLNVRDGSTRTAPIDDLGWFVIKPRPSGTFRLSLRPATGESVVTEWITL